MSPGPSTCRPSAPRSTAFEHEALGRPGEEVGDDRVDRDPPARDRDPGLARRDERARDAACGAPRRRARARPSSSRSRSRSRRSARPSRRGVRFAPAGHVQACRRLAQVAQRDAVLGRERTELGVVGDELVQTVLDVEPARDARAQELAPGRREAPALGRDPDERRRRARNASASSTLPTIGTPSWLLARPAPSRGSRRPARGGSGSPRAPSCRSADRPSTPRRG